jgi:hypothetical protein
LMPAKRGRRKHVRRVPPRLKTVSSGRWDDSRRDFAFDVNS